jgi:hypothetical protein
MAVPEREGLAQLTCQRRKGSNHTSVVLAAQYLRVEIRFGIWELQLKL